MSVRPDERSSASVAIRNSVRQYFFYGNEELRRNIEIETR